MVSCKLLDFWKKETKLKINNYADKENEAHNEEIVRDQIAYAQNNKQKWHNSQHFSYWCRYGPPQVNYRLKQVINILAICCYKVYKVKKETLLLLFDLPLIRKYC